MKSILFPFTHTVVGGSYVSASMLVKYLYGLPDWDVRVCLPQRGLNAPLFEFDGFKPDYLDTSMMSESGLRHKSFIRRLPAHIQAYRLAASYLRDHRPDLVHINDTKTQLIWGFAAKRLEIPVVFHVRIASKSGMDRYCIPFARHLILVSDAIRGRLAGHKKIPPHETIYDAVDFDTFYPPKDRSPYKAKLGLAPDRLTVGFAGNLVARKRPEWAVKAALDLLERGLDVQLVIVGWDQGKSAEYKHRLKVMAEEAGFAERIHFLGYRDDIPDVMRAMDLLLLASVEEGEGLARVVIEAMASGVAVVATRTAGIPETLDHGVSGLITDPNDYDAFLEAVHRLTKDASLRRNISEQAQREVRSRFSMESGGERLLGVYDRVLNGAAAQPPA